MIRVSQVKLPVGHEPEALTAAAAKKLRLPPERIKTLAVRKRSLDARKKPALFYVYTVDVCVDGEMQVLQRARCQEAVHIRKEERHRLPACGPEKLRTRPVIVGDGPAGCFCGLMLARRGFRPLILERGGDVDSRRLKVETFWAGGRLDETTNVQFGEGGAGTFSDGKLNTMVKDPEGLGRLVLRTFCEFGADPAILIDQRPHIGTDVLSGIVKQMREEITRLGGEVRFGCQVTGLEIEGGRISGVRAAAGPAGAETDPEAPAKTGDGILISAEVVILAVGHSARDTFAMLEDLGIPMTARPFAVGLRVQHPQAMINLAQYGCADAGEAGAAVYRLTAKTTGGRGVYTFCMCPGGYVVNASSERGRLTVNGMSYHDRAGVNANSAVVVTVGPADFARAGFSGTLGGAAFQQKLEEAAFAAAGRTAQSGAVPVQLYGDFRENRPGTGLGDVSAEIRGRWAFGDVRGILPDELNLALMEGMEQFGRKLAGFDRPDAVLAGVESRTSSPVRILRDGGLESEVRGLFPCGEGAGYAGGITSAAMDGIRVAEAVIRRFSPAV